MSAVPIIRCDCSSNDCVRIQQKLICIYSIDHGYEAWFWDPILGRVHSMSRKVFAEQRPATNQRCHRVLLIPEILYS